MLVEVLREKQEDLVLMHFCRSAWHLPLPVALDVPLAWARMGWERDVGPCTGWLLCLQMQNLGPQ